MEIKSILLIAGFAIGYLAIIFEFVIKINKTAAALALAVGCWLIECLMSHQDHVNDSLRKLTHDVSGIAQIVFFLLAAMTVVEIIDSHKGFHMLSRWLHHRSKRVMLWTISLVTFFASAVLDNLTTTILMISILRKLVPSKKDRMYLLCMVVIAANAGGAWTPIGDVTTTMLWINGQLSTLAVMKELFLPSFICMLVPCLIYTCLTKGNYKGETIEIHKESVEPGAKRVFCIGVASLVAVPIFKWLTGLPPFMGMLIALAVVWLVTDFLHRKHEEREHLRIPFVLTKIDVSSLLFFLGILLGIDALEAAGILDNFAIWMNHYCRSDLAVASGIGIASSVIDNIPLVAATMGMYDLSQHPIDSNLWMLIAYAAGTGGSILLIGSSSGITLMGLEKIHFFTYLKKATLPALAGFLAGIGIYQIFRFF